MYGMNKECGQDEMSAKLQVLDEIKELMDKRLGGKLGEMANPKGVEVASVKLMGEEGESPMEEKMEMSEENESGVSEEDLMKLKMARSKMLG